MKELYDLKEMLCDELAEYGKKELTAGSLDVVDKLSHALKSVTTIIAMEDAGDYSNDYGYDKPYSTRNVYRGNSYARRRRDSMGRYSRNGYSGHDDEMIEQLKDIMDDAPNDQIRQEVQRLVSKLEKM